MTGSAIGQSLLGSGKGVGQSGPFTVGNRPCDGCSGDWRDGRRGKMSSMNKYALEKDVYSRGIIVDKFVLRP